MTKFRRSVSVKTQTTLAEDSRKEDRGMPERREGVGAEGQEREMDEPFKGPFVVIVAFNSTQEGYSVMDVNCQDTGVFFGKDALARATWLRDKLNAPDPRKDAVAAVVAERQRQISVEGWTAAHDDEHDGGEMAIAAACYALHATDPVLSHRVPWPWHREWWKPKDARRDLVRAAALVIAEIERLDRATKPDEV